MTVSTSEDEKTMGHPNVRSTSEIGKPSERAARAFLDKLEGGKL